MTTVTRPRAAAPGRAVFELSGGRLALDFANTVDARSTPRRRDGLAAYADLVAWGRQAGVLDLAEGRALARAAAGRRREAAAVLRRARAFREALFGVAAAVTRGIAPPPADLRAVEAEVREAAGHARLAGGRGRLRWTWEPGPALDRVLWPVARDAGELFTSPAAARVRECAADDCAWLFVDRSRNASRIWCDMKVCGNRAKARRHYARARRRARG